MPLPALTAPVPLSVGLNRPQRPLPPGACDSHMHIFDARFTPSPHWPRTPPQAPVAAYRQLQQRLGTARAVVVTPSTYGTNNACTLDALDQLGDSARGVAVVDHGVSDAELARLAARRVRGLRVNYVSPQSWGITTPEMLTTLADKVARHADCGGWHIQVFAHPEQIVALAPVLQALPVPLVIDHLGRIDPAEGPSAQAFGVLRRLLDSATPGSSSRAPTCARPCTAPAMPTRCHWARHWCRPPPIAWYGAATGPTPPRRRAP